jgi:hypothetical protein
MQALYKAMYTCLILMMKEYRAILAVLVFEFVSLGRGVVLEQTAT